MDHTQLKAVAAALLGFVPEWTPSTCDAVCDRIEELDTIPAVYLRAVVENMKARASTLRYAGVILSPKWAEFIPQQLTQMQEEAKVRIDSDLVEFRSAMRICNGAYEDILEDENFNISDLGRYRIAKMYGLTELADKLELAAAGEALANPFLADLYDKLKEDD